MRIVSGATNAYLHFVAVSTSDHITRVTGLTSFNVYVAASSASTGSTMGLTVNEVNSTQMPGLYRVMLADSSAVTVGSGFDSREVCLHITSSMDPVTRTYEVYRRSVTSGVTLTVNSSGEAATSLGTILSSVNAKVTSVDSRLSSMDTMLSSVNAKVTSVDSRLTSMDTMLSSVNAKVTSVDVKVSSMNTQVTSILANVTSIDSKVSSIDTKVTAIQAQTTQLAFTQSGKVDANIHYVNNVLVTGVGSTVDPWGP
jgi:septation ring formation regulator EzrA